MQIYKKNRQNNPRKYIFSRINSKGRTILTVLPEGKTGPTDHWPVVEDASACKMENCARQMVSRDICCNEVCVCLCVCLQRMIILTS